MYYIYRYLNNDKVIYIGITNNLKARRSQHSISSSWYKEDLKYEYLKVDNKYIAENFEIYLINRDTPIENKVNNNKYDVSKITFNIDENWIIYKEGLKENNLNLSKLKLKKSLKNQKKEEDIIKTFQGFDDIFYNKRNLITEINYDKYGRLFVTFDSKEIQEWIIKSKWVPRYLSSISYSTSNDDNKVNFFIEDKNVNWLEEDFRIKLNEIYNLLDIDRLYINKQAEIKKEILRLEEKEARLTAMVNNNDCLKLIKLKTWETIKVPINNLFLIARGIESINDTGYGLEITFKNQKNMLIYFHSKSEIRNHLRNNVFDYSEYCFNSDEDKDLFWHKIYLSQIDFYICGNEYILSLNSEKHRTLYLKQD